MMKKIRDQVMHFNDNNISIRCSVISRSGTRTTTGVRTTTGSSLFESVTGSTILGKFFFYSLYFFLYACKKFLEDIIQTN